MKKTRKKTREVPEKKRGRKIVFLFTLLVIVASIAAATVVKHKNEEKQLWAFSEEFVKPIVDSIGQGKYEFPEINAAFASLWPEVEKKNGTGSVGIMLDVSEPLHQRLVAASLVYPKTKKVSITFYVPVIFEDFIEGQKKVGVEAAKKAMQLHVAIAYIHEVFHLASGHISKDSTVADPEQHHKAECEAYYFHASRIIDPIVKKYDPMLSPADRIIYRYWLSVAGNYDAFCKIISEEVRDIPIEIK